MAIRCKGEDYNRYQRKFYLQAPSLSPSVTLKLQYVRVGLCRQYAGLTLLSPIQEEAHSGAQVLQVQVRQEAPLKFRLHRVSTGSTAALQENNSRLAQQPIDKLSHASAILIGQGLPSPEAKMQHVSCHMCTGALQSNRNMHESSSKELVIC